jgi:hypothetical protein
VTRRAFSARPCYGDLLAFDEDMADDTLIPGIAVYTR